MCPLFLLQPRYFPEIFILSYGKICMVVVYYMAMYKLIGGSNVGFW